MSAEEVERINDLIRAHQSSSGKNTFRQRRRSLDNDGHVLPRKMAPLTSAEKARATEVARINELIARKNVERAQKQLAAEAVPTAHACRRMSAPAELHYGTATPCAALSPASSPLIGHSSPAGDPPARDEKEFDEPPKSTSEKERPPRDTTRWRNSGGDAADADAAAAYAARASDGVTVGHNARGTARATRRFRLLLHMRTMEQSGGGRGAPMRI